MKQLVLATALTLASGIAAAEPFAFEKALGSPDLDPSLDNPTHEFPPVIEPGPEITSLDHIYRGNPDGMGDVYRWDGIFLPSAPFAISLYEIYRGNPDGGGHDSYYKEYPAGTDWEHLAREHRKSLNVTGDIASVNP